MTTRLPSPSPRKLVRTLPGDEVYVEGKWKNHFGTFTHYDRRGIPWFIHTVPGRGCVHEPLRGFAGGRPVILAKRAPPGTGHLVVRRAMGDLGKPYDALFLNCEHVANHAMTGRRESPLRVNES